MPPKDVSMKDLDELIMEVADEVAQEVAERAADQVAEQKAGSPDETFIKRRFATTQPDDPEMKAAWDEAAEIVEQAAIEDAQKAAEQAAEKAPSIAYKRMWEMLRGRPNEAEEVVHRVASATAQKAAERAKAEVHDEAYERTWDKVYETVWSTMFPEEFRKAMVCRRPQSNRR
jgi:hypothetical protein